MIKYYWAVVRDKKKYHKDLSIPFIVSKDDRYGDDGGYDSCGNENGFNEHELEILKEVVPYEN